MTAVAAYQLLPTSSVDVVGRALPMVEVVVGGCLVLGLLTRVAGVSAVLQVAFVVGIASVWARGISITAAASATAATTRTQPASTPGRSPATLGLLALVAVRRVAASYLLALDNMLFPENGVRSDVEAAA